MTARTNQPPRSRVVVIATGGTIASRHAAEGGAVATDNVAAQVNGAGPEGVRVEGRDLFRLGSYLIGHREMRLIAQAVAEETAREDVAGVVVTHGTDTMEETGFLLDLVHTSGKPVVLTGAQLAADAPDTDGPRNLDDAVTVAASEQAAGYGVVIVFAGQIFAAARTRKLHTVAAAPFRSPDSGALGRVGDRRVHMVAAPSRPASLPPPTETFDNTRVDVVALHPGADAVLAQAAVAAGASGVVLAGTGSGNGNHTLVEWTRQAVDQGIAVGLSTRVPEGPVIPVYGNGGGVDLVNAGATNLGFLPLFHGRLLLALLLAAGEPVTAQTLAPHS